MQQIITLGLTALLALALVACGGDTGPTKKPSGKRPTKTPSSSNGGEETEPSKTPEQPAAGTGGYAVVEVEKGGTLSGAVLWTGDVPADELSYEYTAAQADAEVCAAGGMGEGGKRKNVRLQLGDRDGGKKGVANVVVRVETAEGVAYKAPAEVKLDNKNCEFWPTVQLFGPTTHLTITNSDGTTHNTKGQFKEWGGESEQLFNENLKPNASSKYEGGFTGAGLLRLVCDQHYWMEAYAVVQNHPYYAVTDEKGNFKIGAPLKPGKYTVHFWHSNYKLRRVDGKMKGFETPISWTREVEIKEGDNSLEVDFPK